MERVLSGLGRRVASLEERPPPLATLLKTLVSADAERQLTLMQVLNAVELPAGRLPPQQQDRPDLAGLVESARTLAADAAEYAELRTRCEEERPDGVFRMPDGSEAVTEATARRMCPRHEPESDTYRTFCAARAMRRLCPEQEWNGRQAPCPAGADLQARLKA